MDRKKECKERKNERRRKSRDFNARCLFMIYAVAVLLITVGSITVHAEGDPITVVNNLSDFIFGLIRAIGMILLGFGIVQVGLSLKSHDPSQ